MYSRLRRFGILITILLFLFSFSVLAEPTTETQPNRMVMVSDNEEIDKETYYYDGKVKVKTDAFNWIDGYNGKKAVSLNGKSQYLRLATAQTRDLRSLTFSSWVYWRGNRSTGTVDNQKLLTWYRNESYFFSVSVHASDPEKGLDGICLELGDPSMETITLFKPVDEHHSTALYANEWHHIAVTVSDNAIALYVDGVCFLSEEINVDLAAMDLRTLKVGAGFENEPYFNGALQDTFLYDTVLTDNQILLLAQGKDPLSGEIATTTTGALATRPIDPLQPHKSSADNTLFGLPLGLFSVLAILIACIATLSIVFSIRNDRSQQNGGDAE